MENECTSHIFGSFAIFLPKIIKIGKNLTQFWQKQICLVFWDTVYKLWAPHLVYLLAYVIITLNGRPIWGLIWYLLFSKFLLRAFLYDIVLTMSILSTVSAMLSVMTADNSLQSSMTTEKCLTSIYYTPIFCKKLSQSASWNKIMFIRTRSLSNAFW